MPDQFTPPPIDSWKGPASAATFSSADVKRLVSAAAKRHGIDEDLLLSVAHQESGFRPTAKSAKGAIGTMQLMPGTAKDLKVDPANVVQNIEGGAQYLSQMLKRYGGDRNKALAAYNAGPGRVDAGGTLPKETQDYVSKLGTSGEASDPDVFTPPPISSWKGPAPAGAATGATGSIAVPREIGATGAPKPKPQTWGQAAVDLASGFGGAALESAKALSIAGEKLATFGLGDQTRKAWETPTGKALTAPIQTPAGRAGRGLEQIGELVATPELKASQLPAWAARLATRGNQLRLGVQSGVESARMGTQAVMHGEDPKWAMAAGAVAPIAGATLKSISNSLYAGARHLYEQALNPTRIVTKAETEKIVPELMQKNFWATTFPRYVKQTEEQLGKATTALEEAWKKIPEGTRINVTPVLDSLRESLKRYSVPLERTVAGARKVSAAATEQAIAARAKILNQFKLIAQYGSEVSPENARKIRQVLEKAPAKKGAYVVEDAAVTALEQAQEHASNALRNEINKIPQVAKENAAYHFWRMVNHVAKATEDRKIGQKGLQTILSFTGIAAGDVVTGRREISDIPGIFTDALMVTGALKLATATGVKTLTANILGGLAKAVGERNATRFFEVAGLATQPPKSPKQSKQSPWQVQPMP